MIHPDTKVMWLDTNNGRNHYDTIEQLFIEYAEKVQRVGQNCRVIHFGVESPLKTQDWQGWTTVLAIKCFEDMDPNWINVLSRTNPQVGVIVSKFELIPLYNMNMLKQGFHGSIKYPYMLKNPEKINPLEDRIRVRGDLEGEIPEFLEPMWAHYDSFMKHGYEIITASNFYNANNIHLYGNDEIPTNAIEEWGWK